MVLNLTDLFFLVKNTNAYRKKIESNNDAKPALECVFQIPARIKNKQKSSNLSGSLTNRTNLILKLLLANSLFLRFKIRRNINPLIKQIDKNAIEENAEKLGDKINRKDHYW